MAIFNSYVKLPEGISLVYPTLVNFHEPQLTHVVLSPTAKSVKLGPFRHLQGIGTSWNLDEVGHSGESG